MKETLSAHVKNIGSARSTPCKLRFYMKNKGTKIFNIPALNEGEVFTACRSERWYAVGRKRIDIRVDSDNTVKEASERNNFLRTSVLVIGTLKEKYPKPNYVCSDGNSGDKLDSTWVN